MRGAVGDLRWKKVEWKADEGCGGQFEMDGHR